ESALLLGDVPQRRFEDVFDKLLILLESSLAIGLAVEDEHDVAAHPVVGKGFFEEFLTAAARGVGGKESKFFVLGYLVPRRCSQLGADEEGDPSHEEDWPGPSNEPTE